MMMTTRTMTRTFSGRFFQATMSLTLLTGMTFQTQVLLKNSRCGWAGVEVDHRIHEKKNFSIFRISLNGLRIFGNYYLRKKVNLASENGICHHQSENYCCVTVCVLLSSKRAGSLSYGSGPGPEAHCAGSHQP